MSEGQHDPVGMVGEEATRLFAEAQRWWRDAHTSAGDRAPSEECMLCPICQVLTRLRQARPEVLEHLTAAAISVAQAVRATLDAADSARQHSDAGPAVERIDIR